MKTRENKLILVMIILISLLIGMSINSILNSKVVLINEKQIIKEMTEVEYESKITELNTSHEDYALQVQENKKRLATAITNEKVATSEDATIDEIVTNIGKILQVGTSDATATADDITQGKTAYINGKLVTGVANFSQNMIAFVTTGVIGAGNNVPIYYPYDKSNDINYIIEESGTYNCCLITISTASGLGACTKVYVNEQMQIYSNHDGSVIQISYYTGTINLNEGDILKCTAGSEGHKNEYNVTSVCLFWK